MCDQCEKYSDHIADLRNKYDRIYSYFKFYEEVKTDEESYVQNPFHIEAHKRSLKDSEKTIVEDNKQFSKLLKIEIYGGFDPSRAGPSLES